MKTEKQLKEKVVEQLRFIHKSSNYYDSGDHSEAIRIAAAIRILIHDTKNSKSLLKQLEKKDIPFFDSSIGENEQAFFEISNLDKVVMGGKEDLPYAALLAKKMYGPGQTKLEYLPIVFYSRFDNNRHLRPVPFDVWWSLVVFDDYNGNKLTRKDLILTMTNKDGGAHVDEKLPSQYERFKENVLFHSVMGNEIEVPINIPLNASVYQIGFEIIVTFINSLEISQDEITNPKNK